MDKPLNQSLQSGSEKKRSYMSSIGSSNNYCGALEVNLKEHVLKKQNRGSIATLCRDSMHIDLCDKLEVEIGREGGKPPSRWLEEGSKLPS